MADAPLSQSTGRLLVLVAQPGPAAGLAARHRPRPPDLLLRSLEPPLITAGGMDLVTLLRPAYLAMTSSDQVAAPDGAGHSGPQ